MSKTYRVAVTQMVDVTLDDAKFDEAFLTEFRESFYNFDTIEEHAEHIAQLQARNLIDLDWKPTQFVEGYGPADEMGLTAKVVDTTTELEGEVLP